MKHLTQAKSTVILCGTLAMTAICFASTNASSSTIDSDVEILWDNEGGLNNFTKTKTVKLNDGFSYKVSGNGANSEGGRTELLLTNISDGTVLVIDTGSLSDIPNGLSEPALVDKDGNGTIDIAFAGDVEGNLWKFDLNSSHGFWDMDYKLHSNLENQSITGISKVTTHPDGGFIIYFLTSNKMVSSGVWDNGSPPSVNLLAGK